ncbi:MAG TPA: hypothetical protein VJZ69_01890, partial [Clostridia bacterium]|nr:hypothetical protein [Clostridia bacterium]
MKNLLLFALLCAFFVLPFNSALATSAIVVPSFEITEGSAEQNAEGRVKQTAECGAEQVAEDSEEQNADTVKYNGKIYHIFFHSLILYPEMAFKSQNAKGYNDWMTTRSEFKKILNKLYENNFVLVDIDLVRQAKGKGFNFPKGKKPLIISVDDVNYYETMKGDGFAEKLIVDENGEIATTVRTPKDAEIIDYEGDVIPIVNRFVKAHPNFSFRGAKGIVGVTGFDGVFGYRVTKLKGDAYNKAFKSAKYVANSLKANGWKIA